MNKIVAIDIKPSEQTTLNPDSKLSISILNKGKLSFSIIQFRADLVHKDCEYKRKLFKIVLASRNRDDISTSAANAIINSVYCLTHNTQPGDTYSISLCSKGEYGIDEGLIFSYPCTTKDGTIKVEENIKHNEFAQRKIDLSLEELRDEKEIVEKLKLI